jgi:hypothetical protein
LLLDSVLCAQQHKKNGEKFKLAYIEKSQEIYSQSGERFMMLMLKNAGYLKKIFNLIQ